ncbi:MAG: hypothetical protein LUC93_16230 [Planctomycetaceae bacterium]|nr:hypothetical protein [Planctomycetaceae bacterium]
MKRSENTAGLRRNLIDAGCNAAAADTFMNLQVEGKTQDQLRLLKAHRAALLKKLRANQKKIDCLDYLLFTMTQETKQST